MSQPTHDEPSATSATSATSAGGGGGAGGDEDLLVELADEFAVRLRRREHPDVEEYAARQPALADRVRKVLSAIALLEDARSDSPSSAGDPAGSTVGRYKLLERIGEGGFGVVYMAEQTSPVRRKVALKIVKPGMDSRQVLARFEAERQALAIMDHPNIAKVFDGGMSGAGRPYFVMELVRGEPITSYCDANQLPPRARLELFVQVCDAVQHAHQKGIIHRDIKPTNVLVMMHDTKPVVKVIDFGVAKALGQELTERTLFTGFAQLVGTPLYMSPEQAGESGIDVDTRSDIYSLGVLLYELLTGTTPFDRERFRRAAQEEIRRIIREEEPPRPSTRLSESKDRLPSISAQRHTEPGKLTKLVRGELDWIVMKALEKDRARRYETANGFARDVERYLKDEAVLACPPSAAYRLRKLARRHRGAVAAASAGVTGLIFLVVILAVSNRIISASNDEKAEALRQKEHALAAAKASAEHAEAQRKRAEDNFLKARVAVRDLLMQPVIGGSGWEQLPASVRKQFADRAISYYESLLQGDGVASSQRFETAVGQRALGYLYAAKGESKRADEMLRQSIRGFEGLHRESPGDPKVRQQLAWSHFLMGRNLWGRDPEAELAVKRSLDFYDGLVAERSRVDQPAVEAMMVYYRSGELFERAGKLDEAERLFDRAVAVHEQRNAQVPSDPEDPYICLYVSQWNVGVAAKRVAAGRMKDAAELYARALAVYPDQHERWCEAAALHLSTGDVERYRDSCREILSRFEKSAAESPDAAVRTARTCALAHGAVDDFAHVERLAERGVTGTEHHASRRNFILARGLAELRAGRAGQAVRWLHDFGPRAGGTHHDAAAFAALAMAHRQLGEPDEAGESAGAARAIIARKPDDAMKGVAWSDWLHCEILCREAEQLLAESSPVRPGDRRRPEREP